VKKILVWIHMLLPITLLYSLDIVFNTLIIPLRGTLRSNKGADLA